jgi:predicted nucleic acid-binding protein
MPKPVVSNSSPIIHLAKIGHLNLLQEFFCELLIPEAVYEECITDGKGRTEVSLIKQASWLRVVQVANQNLFKLLNSEIDRGEAEAITLALESQASLILLDDSDAREKARLYQLPITGTLGLLLRARKSGKVTSLSEKLDALRNTGFWLNAELGHRLLSEVGER